MYTHTHTPFSGSLSVFIPFYLLSEEKILLSHNG